MPEDARVRALAVDQLSNANYMVLLMEDNTVYSVGSLSIVTSDEISRKPDPFDGPPALIFRDPSAGDVLDVTTSAGRVFISFASGRLCCVESLGVLDDVRPDGTRLNAAGQWAKKGDNGHYFCGRKHSGCKCKSPAPKCTLCTVACKCRCRDCQKLDQQDKHMRMFANQLTVSIYPHPLGSLTKSAVAKSKKPDCAHCKAKHAADFYHSTLMKDTATYCLCPQCVKEHLLADIAVHVKQIEIKDADAPLVQVAATRDRLVALSSKGTLYDSLVVKPKSKEASPPEPTDHVQAGESRTDSPALATDGATAPGGAASPPPPRGAAVVAAAAAHNLVVTASDIEGNATSVGVPLCAHSFSDAKDQKAQVCPSCGLCTEYGKKCYRSALPGRFPALVGRTAGELCGCGAGNSGCTKCGICRSCAEKADQKVALEIGGGARLSGHDEAGSAGPSSPTSAGDAELQPATDLTQGAAAAAADDSDKRREKASPSDGRLKGFLAKAIPTLEPIAGDELGWPEGTAITKLVAGSNFFLAQSGHGELLAMGSNTQGQLGFPLHVVVARTFLPVPLPAEGLRVKDIAVGGSHSLVVLTDGRVLAFGDNSHLQLGSGASRGQPAPLSGESCMAFGSPVARAVAIGDRSFLWYGEEVVPRDMLSRAQATSTESALLLTFQAGADVFSTAAFNLASGNFLWSEAVPHLQHGRRGSVHFDATHSILFTLSKVGLSASCLSFVGWPSRAESFSICPSVCA